MRKLLIGPVLSCAGYAAGAYYGSDAEQIIHKKPEEVQAAIEQLVSDRESGTMQLSDGKSLPYELKLDDHATGEPLLVRLSLNGREAVDTRIHLTPEANGTATLIAVQVHTDRSVLRDELAGTSKARLAYAPDWMLNLTARPVLQKLAEQIESGEALGDPMKGFETEADWEASLPAEQQKQIQEWRQYDASRPTVDPNADAQRYLSGVAGSASNRN
jgi:hypothetical protein